MREDSLFSKRQWMQSLTAAQSALINGHWVLTPKQNIYTIVSKSHGAFLKMKKK